MDFDTVEEGNLDRLIRATPTDARLRRAKVEVARRLVLENATARPINLLMTEDSVCEPLGVHRALDFDLVICCVDRPWPRAVLNQIAYTDLIPVIDGGITIDVFDDGSGMRNATWRSHVIRPGRPASHVTASSKWVLSLPTSKGSWTIQATSDDSPDEDLKVESLVNTSVSRWLREALGSLDHFSIC